MLSTDYETKIKMNKRELLDCIDRATLLVKEGDKKPVIIDVKDTSMQLKMNSTVGSMDEDIDIDKKSYLLHSMSFREQLPFYFHKNF